MVTGDVRTHRRFHSNFLETRHDVVVWLPPSYAHTQQHYPVLYLHDGQNLFDPTTAFCGQEWCVDEISDAMVRQGEIDPLIIVGIYNAGAKRIDEYTPTRDRSMKAGGRSAAYGRMLVEELKPFIDKRYRTRSGPQHTGLGGSSLGGLVTLHLGIRYPNVFGKLAVMSPSVWWDRKVILELISRSDITKHPRIWLDTGTAEGSNPEGHLANVRELRDLLYAKGWSNETLAYIEAEGHGHNEDAWRQRVGPMLKFLFPRHTLEDGELLQPHIW